MHSFLTAWRTCGTTLMILLLSAASCAQTNPSPPLLWIQSIPVGARPVGIGMSTSAPQGTTLYTAVVANSAGNSISLVDVSRFSGSRTVSGIPSPYGVAVCNGNTAFVTSPSDNSVSVVDVVQGVVKSKIKVGLQPYSVDCDLSNAYVSNYGDSSLSVIDLTSLTVTKTVRNVPGSRKLQGVAAYAPGPPCSSCLLVWVAGTDANALTVVNGTTGSVVAGIPVRAPTFVRVQGTSARVGSSTDNAIYTFDASLGITSTISGVSAPQDFLSGLNWSPAGYLATTSSGGLVFIDYSTFALSSITGIPPVAGLSVIYDSYQPGRYPAIAVLTGPDSNEILLIQPRVGVPYEFSLVNGASFGGSAVAQGELATVFKATGVKQNFSVSSLPLPSTLGNVSLRLGGSLNFDNTTGQWTYSSQDSLPAGLLFVGANQINFQVPPGISPASGVPAQFTKADGTTLLTTLTIGAAAPGLFSTFQNGQGQAAALNQDNSQNLGTRPAARGSVIQIFAAGAGATTPVLDTGAAAPMNGSPLIFTQLQPTVTIGGKNAAVQFSGLAPGFVGLWQINAVVPADVTPGPTVPLYVTIGGAVSNTVTVGVQ